MAKIDIITLSGITASDGSLIASGATVKFNSEFFAASTDIQITLQVYRNRQLFEGGFNSISIPEEILPYDFMLSVPEEEYYVLTPADLYFRVCEYLNSLGIEDLFEIKIITD